MMKAGIVSNVRILDQASYPTFALTTKKRATVLASIVLGLLAGLSFVFVRHILSPVVDDPDLVERRVGVPFTAILPCSQKQVAYNRMVSRNKSYAYSHPFLLSRENPNDLSIESMRSLRTSIQMFLLEAKNNVLAVTGCSPGVGKSFLSSNLAALFSDLNKRVLLIDADIRRGAIYSVFGKKKEPGLSSYLQNEVPLDRIVQSIIPEKLDFIATGVFPKNPAELLSQSKLGEMIKTLSAQYDLVIIDTPPILAVTDAALILKYSSVNLLVLGMGKDQLKEVEHAKKLVEKSGVILNGLVFNIMKEGRFGFGYQSHSKKYHYYYLNL